MELTGVSSVYCIQETSVSNSLGRHAKPLGHDLHGDGELSGSRYQLEVLYRAPRDALMVSVLTVTDGSTGSWSSSAPSDLY